MNILDCLLLFVSRSVDVIITAIQDRERYRKLLNKFLCLIFTFESGKGKLHLRGINFNIFILVTNVYNNSFDAVLHGRIQSMNKL